jgi:[ribosomal protein S5]-alanine N-acetyltransferase
MHCEERGAELPGVEQHRVPPPVRILTNRLLIRLAEANDVLALLRYYHENVAHLAPTSPALPPDFLTEAFWLRQVERNQDDFAQGRAVKLFLFDMSELTAVVGQISLNNIVRRAAYYCDLGYSLAENRQGQGLMREALVRVLRYAFDDVGLHRVKAAYLPSNERSGRLLRGLGFVVEGYARDYLLIQGRWQDQILVGLTNPDWRDPD